LRRVMKVSSLLLAGSLALVGCGSNNETTDTPGATDAGAPSTDTDTSAMKVGLAYDIGGRGDQSFNDSAAAGLDKAKAELKVETQEAEAQTDEPEAAKEERLRQLADAGYNPVIAVGFAYAGPLGRVAKEYSDVTFAIVDDASPDASGPNIANLVFAEEQGSFLVGVAAALKSTSGSVGFVGGVNTELIKKFEAGFKAGAEAGKAGTKVLSTYLSQPPDFSGFTDPAKGKTAAQGLLDQGADVLYHAAGGSGGGVFEAASEGNAKAIGVDSDQYNTADPAVRDVIMTSMVKRVDVAVFDFLESVKNGQFEAGVQTYDLAKGGVDYSTTGGQIDDIKAQIDDFKQQIIDGAITVPTS
jgi:basic membrane protein A